MRCTLPTHRLLPLIWMLGTACAVPRLDIAAKACPCAEGWTCDPSANACVRNRPDHIRPIAPDGGKGQDFEPLDGGPPTSDATDSATPYPLDAGMPEDGSIPTAASDAGDATLQDAAVTDAGGLDCASLPDRTWLYDGFEPQQFGFTLSSFGTGSHIDTDYEGFPHSGTRSMRAETTLAGKSASTSHWLSEPIIDCTFYLSTHIFVDASAELSSFSVLAVSDQTGQAIRLRYTQQGLELHLDATATTLPLDPKVEVVGRWVQFELVVKVGVEGEVTAYLDGQQAATALTNTHRPLGYSQVRTGIFLTAADQGPLVLYADDFVLKRKPPPRPEL